MAGVPPPKALAALQVYVSNLRRALEPGRAPRTPATVLVTAAPGYALHLPIADVDAWRFEALLRDGSALAERDPDRADGLLREALAVWAGPAYAEFADESWAVPEAGRLEELRLVCVEAGGRVAVRLGRAALVVPALERHVLAHPLREEAVHLLASALYAAGRQGDALAVLRGARERLAHELGVDPGPGLRALEVDVLAQAPHLDAGRRPGEVVHGTGGGAGQAPADATHGADGDAGRTHADATHRTGGDSAQVHGDVTHRTDGDAAQVHGGVTHRTDGDAGRTHADATHRDVMHGTDSDAGQAHGDVTHRTDGDAGLAGGRGSRADAPDRPWREAPAALHQSRPVSGDDHSEGLRGTPGTNANARTFGRERELGILGRVAGEVVRGGLRVVWVGGEAGAGKTTLVRMFAARLGWRVAWGRCPEVDGAPPAWAWREVLRDLPHDADVRLAQLLSPGTRDAPAGGQFALAQAVGEHLAGFGPLLVVLDDVHRADGETLQVLRHVAVAFTDRPLLVLATHRPGESRPHLDPVRAALAGHRAVDVDLGGLDPDAGRALLRSLGVPGDAVDVVVERTGGNPLFLTETARLVSAEGADSAVRAIPSGIGHVLRRRLTRLPATAQTVLRHAAVLGRDVDIDLLVAADGSSEDAVLDALEAGVVSGLLEEPAAGQVRFTHALLRDVLYDDMPLLRRRRLHARVLAALEEAGSPDVAALGHHALAAATPATATRAAGYAAAAARQAAALYAHREAATLFRGALDAGPLPPALRHDLLCGLTSALANAGDVLAARSARAEALSSGTTVEALTAYDAPVAWTIRADRAVDVALVASLEAALATADKSDRCRLLVALVYELEGDDLARCDAASAEALALAGDDPLLRCHALNARYFAVLNPARRHELPAVGAQLLEVATAAGLVQFQAQAHHVLFQVALERNDLAAAQEHVDRAVRHATAGQLGVALSVLALFAAVRAVFAGDLGTAERLYADLTARIARTGQPNAALVGVAGVFFVHLAAGTTNTLMPMLQPVYERLPDALNDYLVRALLDGGQIEEARALWSPDAVAVREDYYWLAWTGLRALNAAALRSESHCRELYAVLLPWAGQFVGLASGSLAGPPVDLVLADLADALDDPVAARSHRAAGQALAAAAGAVPWLRGR
ncbi:BTAD domain-containing putative transcriptional regulator [Dactylosporangium cerinum]